jgi:hypothetical protein
MTTKQKRGATIDLMIVGLFSNAAAEKIWN